MRTLGHREFDELVQGHPASKWSKALHLGLSDFTALRSSTPEAVQRSGKHLSTRPGLLSRFKPGSVTYKLCELGQIALLSLTYPPLENGNNSSHLMCCED